MAANTQNGTRFGYLRASAIVNRLLNLALALCLLVLATPLMMVIYFLIVLTGGTPGFYVGTRLGLRKKRFKMLKFRTLVVGAEQVIGAELLTDRHGLMTPMGRFLRDTRLDELPQLINVVLGQMDFVGPRPVRPAVYQNVCRFIRDYDRRFRVKPGILGLAQLLTPHSTPKRIRALIDNMLVRKKQKLGWDIWFIAYTVGMVARKTATQLFRSFYDSLLRQRVLRSYKEKRQLVRVEPEGVAVVIPDADSGRGEVAGELKDINEEAFLVVCDRQLRRPYPERFELELRLNWRTRGRGVRRGACRGSVYREIQRDDGRYAYVIAYEPLSPFNFYIFQQYFLEKSVG